MPRLGLVSSLTGGAPSQEAAFSTYSLNFGGTDEVLDCGDVPDEEGISDYPFTMAAWIKPTHDLQSGAAGGWVMGISATSITYGRHGIKILGAGDSINKAYLTSSWSGEFAQSISDNILTDGNWYHVAGVFTSNASRQLYINGSSDDTTGEGTHDRTYMLGAYPTVLTIGMQRQNTDRSFYLGGIDDAAIWNVALTAADLLKIYNDGVPTDLTDAASYDSGDRTGDLKGYWKMEEGTGSSVADSSGSGNIGTLENMESGDWSTDVPS